MGEHMKVIAVIPAYNVQDTVSRVIDGIRSLVDDIIVVNDASIDKTSDILGTLDVMVVHHHTNLGLGGALRDGFKEALQRGADIVVTLDSDGQHDPSDIQSLLERLQANKVDVIIGSRLLDRRDWSNFPRHRLYGNRLLTWLTNLAIGHKVTTDSQSGYRVLKREVLEHIDLKGWRMEIASEIVYEAAEKGFKLDDVPIRPTYDREISHVNIVWDSLRIIRMLLKKKLGRFKSMATK